MNKVYRYLGGLFLLLGLIGFSTVSTCITAQPEIKIGLIVPLSGEDAQTSGQPALNVAQMAVNEVNETGG